MTATMLDGTTGVAPGGPPARSFGATEERILTASLGLIGRRGVRRLGMREIAETAGVSRGTLYRYFPSKDHVLAAAADYDARRFSDGLDEVLAAARTPEDRITRFMATPSTSSAPTPAAPSSSPSPGFVMGYLLDHLPSLRGELVLRLGDALDAVPVVAAGTLGREQLADVIVRLFASSWIIPEPDDASLVQSVNRILQISSEENT